MEVWAKCSSIEMSDQITNSRTAKFFLWFCQNVFMPLLPILISALTDKLVSAQTHILNEETILIYTILLPVLYLEDSDGKVRRYIFWGISAVGIVLYTVARVISDLPPASRPPSGTDTIFHLAAILDGIYIVTASAYEAYNTFSSNRQVA